MGKRHVAAALTAAACAMPALPASADHTLCDNESSDTWVREVEMGADTDDVTGGTLYVCVGMRLVVVRARGQQTYCSYYEWRGTHRDCVYVG